MWVFCGSLKLGEFMWNSLRILVFIFVFLVVFLGKPIACFNSSGIRLILLFFFSGIPHCLFQLGFSSAKFQFHMGIVQFGYFLFFLFQLRAGLFDRVSHFIFLVF